MSRPPSAMSNMRPPATLSSRPASRASSNPSPNHDKQVPTKRPQGSLAKATEASTTVHAQPSSSETNIQVVVRCRDRNKREIEENSGVIVAPSKDGHSITVQTSALTELNNKTYTFDRVFGGGASQHDVFDGTVEPIVQEMLGGYNCTIFAYGQTGTGKTYTMSGDMSDHCGGIPPATAGIIPRALCRIFQILDQAGDEYSVKCSFIELYNEELRDLLSIQEDQKVKIFDDSTKKGGIIINGMEELAVNNANHGVKILQEGSRKREVAATKCNEASSRSHSVFTITVHIKQTSTEGEDMLRVGKLNLVDLAGSENVGRSGAENKRAREAGMINQSLLTLGRVINALVDRSQHIPYRESKLTRLLQDSLGGRTKTCIIATLSPAKINMDETVSTLEYANRAKSIKNKPQVNQMMTKKALIKDYIVEIERLKGDLNSTRMKNGVYMTEESHLELVNQNESNKLLTEEQQRKIDAMEAQIQSTKEQFEATVAVYAETKRELEKTNKVLSATESKLTLTEKILDTTTKNLEDETILRKAHQATEDELNSLAHSLKGTLQDTVKDVKGLHAKIDRKRNVESLNRESWAGVNQDLLKITKSVNIAVARHAKEQSLCSDAIADRITTFVVKEMKLFSDGHQYLDNQMADFDMRKLSLTDSLGHSQKAIDGLLDEMKDLREEVKSRLGQGLQGLNQAAERIVEEIAGQMGVFQKDIYESYDSLASEFKQVFNRTEKHIASQSAEILRLKVELHAANMRTTTAITHAARELKEAHIRNREADLDEETKVMAQIQAMMLSLSSTRQARQEKTNGQFQQKVLSTVTDMEDHDIRTNTSLDLWTNADGVFGRKLAKDKEDIKKSIVRSWDTAKERTETIQQSTEIIHKETVQLVDAAIQNVDTQTQALEEFVTRARMLNNAHHSDHQKVMSDLSANVLKTHHSVQHEFTKAKAEIESCGKYILNHTSEQRQNLLTFGTEMSTQVEEVREKSQTQMQEDVPTQTTPKKQEYHYTTSWQTTRRHSELLSEERESMDRSPLRDVDVNTTIPEHATSQVEDVIPANPHKSIEKEVLKSMMPGQENNGRPLKTRKRVLG